MFVTGEVAHQMALVPLVWLGGLRVRGQRRDAAWWWLAGAFFISWLADTAAHWVNADLVGNLYPITQAALIGLVFLGRFEALYFACFLVAAGVVAVLWHGPLGIDVFLRTVAWGSVVGIVVDRWALGRLRTALLVTFGLGWLAWLGYALWPGWTSWLVYQGTRAVGIALFCAASLRPLPTLKVRR